MVQIQWKSLHHLFCEINHICIIWFELDFTILYLSKQRKNDYGGINNGEICESWYWKWKIWGTGRALLPEDQGAAADGGDDSGAHAILPVPRPQPQECGRVSDDLVQNLSRY